MRIDRVCAVAFSPTGGTERTVRTAAEALAGRLGVPFVFFPFTRPGEREETRIFSAGDFAVVGMPTYAGRLPNKLLPELKAKLRGDGTPAAALVTFGGRGYDNALAELCSVLEQGGFVPTAAGAFACRHAFTDALGFGRPDGEDLAAMDAFSKALAEKLVSSEGEPARLPVPGDPSAPYYRPLGRDGRPVDFLRAKPETDPLRCTGCGECVRLCPMGAVDPDDPASVPGTCIKCFACVRACPRGAKSFRDPAFLSHVEMLEKSCGDRAENETYL